MKSPLLENPRFKPDVCLYLDCPSWKEDGSTSRPSARLIRNGYYRRLRDQKRVRRFLCLDCRRSFSPSRFTPEAWQKKRDLNEPIRKLLCSGVSQRRIARLFDLDPKTVSRKLMFLSERATEDHEREKEARIQSGERISHLQFDEMESFEHTKCKPLSIPLAVCAKSRRILGFSVASMPASGPLAKLAQKKYGQRPDHRGREAKRIFQNLASLLAPELLIQTDQNPKYPAWIRSQLAPSCFTHQTFKGRRGCIVGQGELKKIGFDPLFSLNHTAAMIRANVNRLFRRTWCTTKKIERLADHLWLYVQYHNTVLISDAGETDRS